MDVFVDSNVILDALTERDNDYASSQRLLYLISLGKIKGYISSNQITDIYYVLRKYVETEEKRREYIKTILSSFTVLPLLSSYFDVALAKTELKDFEDAVLEETARVNVIKFIATKNTKDFKRSRVPAVTPAEILTLIDFDL